MGGVSLIRIFFLLFFVLLLFYLLRRPRRRVEWIEAEEDVLQLMRKDGVPFPPVKYFGENFDPVYEIIDEAIKCRATDIHLETKETGIRTRFRIDGILHDYRIYPREMGRIIISRIKVLGEMDVAEKQKSLDGNFSGKKGLRWMDFRVSSSHSVYGENIVIRILDKERDLITFEQLGFSPELIPQLENLISRPHGMILNSGPTGSGKTTTLYAILSRIDSKEKNIITVEEPIEYHLPNVTQIPINVKAGITFASGLRSILRQDPDIIMIGEIRDLETANLAVEAALTGHLVLSTLHANDASGTIIRLMDLKVEPYLISSSLIAVIAQRLVRVLCDECKQPYTLSQKEIKVMELEEEEEVLSYYRPKGCQKCNFTGYYGRTGIFELLIIDDRIRELIRDKASAQILSIAAKGKGMKTLREAGMEKVKMGITSLEEVIRVTQY